MIQTNMVQIPKLDWIDKLLQIEVATCHVLNHIQKSASHPSLEKLDFSFIFHQS